MAILPAEVLFTRAVLAFLALLIVYPHHLKLKIHRWQVTSFFSGWVQVQRDFFCGIWQPNGLVR